MAQLPTIEQVRANFAYYGVSRRELEGCTAAYMERVEDGHAPDQAEWAETWMGLE